MIVWNHPWPWHDMRNIYIIIESAWKKFPGFLGDTRGFPGEITENSRVVFFYVFFIHAMLSKSLLDQSRTGKQFLNRMVHGVTPSVHWLVSRAAPHVLQDNGQFSLEENNGKTTTNSHQLTINQNKAPASSHGSTEAQSRLHIHKSTLHII